MPQRHNPVDLLSGYLFVRFDIASGIHTRHQVICHPSQRGSSVHSIVAESEQDEISYYKNLVIAERYFLECSSCHSRQLFFDKFIHGYNAEGFKIEGVSVDEIVGTRHSPGTNEKITCERKTFQRSMHETFCQLFVQGTS